MKLKYKLMTFFIPLLIIELVIVSLFNIRSFEQDKIAYVFSSTQESTHSALALLNNEIAGQRPSLEIFTAAFDFSKNEFPGDAKSYLQANDSIAYVEIAGQSASLFKKLDSLGQEIPNLKWPATQITVSSNTLLKEPQLSPVLFPERKDLWGLEYLFPLRGYHYPAYRIQVVYKRNAIQQFLDTPRYFQLFLFSSQGEIILTPKSFKQAQKTKFFQDQLKELLKISKSKDASSTSSRESFTREIKGPDQESYLISVAQSSQVPWGFLSVIEKSKTLGAVQKMKRNSIAVFSLLVGLGLILILWLVRALVKNIEILSQGLMDFSKGNLKIKSHIKSNDEIGSLSKVFNEMTDKIDTLVTENREKSRMEGELETARRVQKSMVPKEKYKDGNFEIMGHFEPASECGGDWWYYTHDERFLYVYIADVTGHGVASALLTGAARAAISALQASHTHSLKDFVTKLNQVIFESGGGKLMMTFFMASLDRETGALEYVNASHCPPVLFRKGKNKVANFFLDEVCGPRLGQEEGAKYKSEVIQLGQGDTLLCYTDGLTESSNPANRLFGEKRIFKMISKSLSDSKNTETVHKDLMKDFFEFKEGKALDDDLTLFLVHCRQIKSVSFENERSA